MCVKVRDRPIVFSFLEGRSEDLAMAQMTSQEWVQGWCVVRRVEEKMEFVAVFDTQEDAKAAAVEAGIDCEVAWVTYKDGVGFRPE
jgi:hypothetical protein